ncbi:MAG: helix-turn-helix domain-containing protein [Lachnospiraceae bacterium]|nr:helix-turn-helix domain-containing protein [Lachnospiraceae bacterium]
MDSEEKKKLPVNIWLVLLFAAYHLNMVACCIYSDSRLGWEGPLYYLKESALFVGFFCFFVSRRIIKGMLPRRIVLVVATLGYSLGLLGVIFLNDPARIKLPAILAMFFLGYMGGAVYYYLSAGVFGHNFGGLILSIGLAIAVSIFHFSWVFLEKEAVMLVIMLLGAVAMTYIVIRPPRDWVFMDLLPYERDEKIQKENRNDLWGLVVVSIAIVLVLAKSDAIQLQNYAAIAEDVKASRLFAIPAYLLVGFFHDKKKRTVSEIMLLSSMLMLIWIPNNLGVSFAFIALSVFLQNYLVAWIILRFFALAPKTREPELWAGFSRIIMILDPIFGTFFLSLPPEDHNLAYIMGTVLTLIVTISVMLLMMNRYRRRFEEAMSEWDVTDEGEKKLLRIRADYGLTPRETDVFSVVLRMSGQSVSAMADELGISRTMMYRYLNSISEKTGEPDREKWKEL